MDLMSMIKGQLNESVLGQIGKAVNLPSDTVSKAMNVIVPAQVSVLAQHAQTPHGAQGLFGLLGNLGNLGNFAGLLGGAGGLGGALKIGEAVLPAIFGNKLPGVLSGIASHTGVNQGIIGNLMNMAGPLVLGQLGAVVNSGGLNAAGLGSLLGGLKGSVQEMLPAGLSGALHLGSAAGTIGAVPNLGGLVQGFTGMVGGAANQVIGQVGNVAGVAKNVALGGATSMSNQVVEKRGGVPIWLPILGLLAVAGAGWFLTRPTDTQPSTNASSLSVSDSSNANTTNSSNANTTNSSNANTTDSSNTTGTDSSNTTGTDSSNTTAAVCDKDYTLSVKDGDTVTEPFRFGGSGKGKGYTITVYQANDGRKIGSKDLPNNSQCNWGYMSNPAKGNIKYEVRQIGATDVLSTVTLTVK